MKNRLNQTSMVDYVKTVLSKVSFDGHLFEKELLKALKNLKKGGKQQKKFS